MLRGEGYNVTLAGRGEEALELVRRRQFDLVLVDLFMSQVPGLEILNAALEANRDCLVVVMTGNPSVTSSIEALRMGAWDYLPEAVFGDPPAGADRPGIARRAQGRAKPPTCACR